MHYLAQYLSGVAWSAVHSNSEPGMGRRTHPVFAYLLVHVLAPNATKVVPKSHPLVTKVVPKTGFLVAKFLQPTPAPRL